MGSFIDDVQNKLNRGFADANRSVESMKLKGQMSDAMKRRQQLAAQLGASLYEDLKDIPEYREGREQLFDGIAQIDAERASIQEQLDEIERRATESSRAATTVECPFCHTRVGATDLFCSGCGKPMAEIQAALQASAQSSATGVGTAGTETSTSSSGSVCPTCGNPVEPDDSFCMSCGTKLKDA